MITSDPYGISHAERPWAGPGKRRREMVYTYDTPEQIAMCQRCAKPDCTNCINVGTAKNKTSEKVKRFLELHEKGLTDRELIKATGLARATVCYWRKRLGLPPNAPRPDGIRREEKVQGDKGAGGYGMRAIIRYPGSKWGIADWIISHFPDGYENLVYLEPFIGSGAVFFNKRPGAVETVNDLDGDIVNLFCVLRERPEELKRALAMTPYSREEYDRSFEPCEEPVERARRYMVRTTQAIGAKLDGKCGWRNHKQVKIGGTACKWAGITDTIDAAAARLRGNTSNLVQIERMDALRLIERYNSHDVLMYLDPPYLRATRRSGRLYHHEMDDAGQRALLDAISRSRAKIVLSGYQSDLYDGALAGWHKDTILSQTTSTEKALETIWMNYEPPCRQIAIGEV